MEMVTSMHIQISVCLHVLHVYMHNTCRCVYIYMHIMYVSVFVCWHVCICLYVDMSMSGFQMFGRKLPLEFGYDWHVYIQTMGLGACPPFKLSV